MAAPRIDARIAGLQVGPAALTVEPRWLMAYAAALGESDPRYYDTEAAGGPLAHPLFPVCYEWPVAVAIRNKGLDEALHPLSVHAAHDMVLHGAPRTGDSLRTSARVVGVQRRRTGTLVTVRLSTTDRSGVAVSTTDYASLYRGVELDGEETRAPALTPPPAASADTVRWEAPIDVSAQLAHVYTECARIWNPIHTDIAVARAAGLPGLILHGTATLALAVSRVVARDLDGDPGRVRGVSVRFTGMVGLPSRLVVRGRAADERGVAFDALAADGTVVLGDGRILR
jgi:acyl dehydratase